MSPWKQSCLVFSVYGVCFVCASCTAWWSISFWLVSIHYIYTYVVDYFGAWYNFHFCFYWDCVITPLFFRLNSGESFSPQEHSFREKAVVTRRRCSPPHRLHFCRANIVFRPQPTHQLSSNFVDFLPTPPVVQSPDENRIISTWDHSRVPDEMTGESRHC